MKDKSLIFYLAIIAVALFTFTMMANSGKILYIDGSKSIDEGLENVEDTLILDSLEMNTLEQAMLNEKDTQGQIIYDDSFIDSANDEIIASVSLKNDEDTSQDLLTKLKEKDKRWHITKHTIKKGESIWTVARRFDTDHRLIIQYNNIQKPDHVKPGTSIGVPNKNGFYYTVKKGDTLSEIAVSNKVSEKKIQSQNNIAISDTIKIGAKLFLPDAVKPDPKPKQIKTTPVVSDTNKMVVQNDVEKVSKPGANAKSVTKKSSTSLKFGWPVTGNITSGFGMRNHPVTGKRQFHNGIDIRAKMGTDIKASEKGTVIYSGWKTGYGWMIVVKHPNSYITVYAHLSKRLKKKNDTVKKGDVIAKSGNSGLSTGPHLHFEIRKYETPLNPLRML
jgi:murein DD-endopeptidase MepM/ murein hydrolase activator NlpD